MDDPNVGVILLHPLRGRQGVALSATSGLAPKTARKAYEKGMKSMRHGNPDDASRQFSRAVGIYPKFAAAWLELGRISEARSDETAARNAYAKAIAADPDYVNPYERLYLLDGRNARWQQAAENSEKVLRLDPFGFPRAYYFNAIANLQLHNLEAAEKSAREASKLQGAQAEPRARYILGVILVTKGDLPGAAESLRAFLRNALAGADQEDAKRMLSLIEARGQAATPQADRSPIILAK
jgi:tetratricopeptide (TPR) repeat protein